MGQEGARDLDNAHISEKFISQDRKSPDIAVLLIPLIDLNQCTNL